MRPEEWVLADCLTQSCEIEHRRELLAVGSGDPA